MSLLLDNIFVRIRILTPASEASVTLCIANRVFLRQEARRAAVIAGMGENENLLMMQYISLCRLLGNITPVGIPSAFVA